MSYIILKFDDLDENTVESFKKAQAICDKHNAVSCFGLIGRSLENPSEEYVSSLRGMIESGVELWNHGYYHTKKEFSECTYQQQKESIEATQLLMKKHLGAVATTFGSPHNNSTEKTIQVLADHFPEIQNRFFMADGEGRSDARSLLMRCNYEIRTGEVDLGFFDREYERIKEYPFFVMQGHPSFWKDEDANRFDEILGILTDDRNEFVTAEGLRSVIFPGYMDSSLDGVINDAEAFFVRNKETYYYGAGEIGREVFRFFDKKGLRPDGFIVSDGHRMMPDVCGISVYELSEVCERKDVGIIPTILGRSHESVFSDTRFENMDVWMPETKNLYDRMIDYIRFVLYYD